MSYISIDVFRVASQATLWGEWLSGGPLLLFIAVSFVDKADLNLKDYMIIISFFFCILLGFVPIIPQSYWLGVFWIVMSCISYLPCLYLPFHVSYRAQDFNDLEAGVESHKLKRNRQRFHLAMWLTICFPLFPITYLLAALSVIGQGDTIGVYLILSVLMKALFTAIAMDAHSDALTAAQKSLIDERNANEARRVYHLMEEKVASEARQAFLKYIFHEVRTPLNSLTMGLEILRQGERLSASDLEIVSEMKGASDFMTRTLNDLTSLQKIEDGKLELELSPFSMNDSISKVLSTFLGTITAKHIRVEKKISLDVPNRVIGDRYRVEHVFSNLLSNALKFSPDNSCIEITVEGLNCHSSIRERDGSVAMVNIVVSIKDEGCGISPANKRRLFDSFVQIRPDQLQHGQGSGLGLSLCKQIVALHGGTIGVESTEGQGSTFSFCIPFAVCNDSVYELSQSEGEGNHHSPALIQMPTFGQSSCEVTGPRPELSNTGEEDDHHSMELIQMHKFEPDSSEDTVPQSSASSGARSKFLRHDTFEFRSSNR